MKKIIVVLLVMLTLVGGFPLTAFGQERSSTSKYLAETMSAMVNGKQVKGGVVSFISEGNVELCEGYGIADEESGTAAHGENTGFRIGSISKTFVAIAVLQLAKSGKLDMNSSISNYLEADFPKFKYDITMNHLLTHTAGFEEMISGIAVSDIKKAEPLVKSIRKYIPAQVFIPGEVVSYSNYGIALAAYVVERITGQDFYKYADENIFKPLGMTKTSFELDFKGIQVSKAYGAKGKEVFEHLINLYPEGSVVSTAGDMTKYMQWLMDDSDRVLRDDTKQELFKQHFTMSGELEGMGYTWNRKERNGVLYYDKKGETSNFSSRIAIYPELKTGVLISFNTKVNEEEFDVMMDKITDLLLGSKDMQNLYSGKQSADISGYYITTRSSFENIEKIMNFLIPNHVVHISGSISDGFEMRGKKLRPIGENYYSTPLGIIKFIEKNGYAYLANNTAISYTRINWYESNGFQMLVFSLFAITSLAMAVTGVMSMLSRKKGKMDYLPGGLATVNFALFTVMCILVFVGICNFNLVSMAPVITILGVLIAAVGVGGIVYTVYSWNKSIVAAKSILSIVWNISSVLFCLWMIQVNIL